jgi:cysteine synthase B
VRNGVASSLVDLIGNTPLVELRHFSPKPSVRIYAKLEGQNPTGSIKDRVAKAMLDGADLQPGARVIEPTSGNTGISLALICKLRGYELTCVMPENATDERKRLLELYGAKIIYSPGEQGSNGAVAMALEMAEADPSYYMPYQYGNDANPRAHYDGTAVEILEELEEVTAFVAGLGTGGTLMGNGRRLKEENPDTKLVAAEPLQGELVQGLRSLDDGFIPPIIDLSLLDRKIFVSNRDAVLWTKKLLADEGLFVGVSTGAVARVAARIADELDEGNVVFVAPDDGWKYLSSGVYTKTMAELDAEGVIDNAAFW